jgi:uncharacterized protein YoxC
MALADFSAIDVLWICLSVFLVLVALGFAYVLVRLGGTVGRLTALVKGLEVEVPPVINKVGGTVDRVNAQLDKLDQVTDSAVDAADALDTAVRAVSIAVTRPVQKISGLATGVAHGASEFKVHRDWRGAMQAGREAAARRERDIADELGSTDGAG